MFLKGTMMSIASIGKVFMSVAVAAFLAVAYPQVSNAQINDPIASTMVRVFGQINALPATSSIRETTLADTTLCNTGSGDPAFRDSGGIADAWTTAASYSTRHGDCATGECIQSKGRGASQEDRNAACPSECRSEVVA